MFFEFGYVDPEGEPTRPHCSESVPSGPSLCRSEGSTVLSLLSDEDSVWFWSVSAGGRLCLFGSWASCEAEWLVVDVEDSLPAEFDSSEGPSALSGSVSSPVAQTAAGLLSAVGGVSSSRVDLVVLGACSDSSCSGESRV